MNTKQLIILACGIPILWAGVYCMIPESAFADAKPSQGLAKVRTPVTRTGISVPGTGKLGSVRPVSLSSRRTWNASGPSRVAGRSRQVEPGEIPVSFAVAVVQVRPDAPAGEPVTLVSQVTQVPEVEAVPVNTRSGDDSAKTTAGLASTSQPSIPEGNEVAKGPVPGSESASISESGDLRFSPTTRPDKPEPQHPPEATTQNTDTGKPFLEWQRGTDDWFGFRPKLDDLSVSIQGSLTSDLSKNLSGGANTRGTAVRELFNLNATVDTEKLLKWKGGTFFVNFMILGGDNGQDFAGNALGVSNIDGNSRTQFSELWYEQKLLDDKVAIKVGKIDAGVQFAHPNYGDEFINPSSGLIPNVVGIPAYPDGATGIELVADPTENTYAAVGVFDGAARRGVTTGAQGPHTLHPNDLFLIGEGGLKWTFRSLPVRLVGGGWYHSNDFDRIGGRAQDGNSGGYVMLDHMLWRAAPDKKDDQRGIGGYVMYGFADPDVNEIEHYFGAGFQWYGPFASRPDDNLGVAVNWGRSGGKPASGFTGDEVQVEFYYKIKLLPWLTVKPDLQYISNPGGDAGSRDAFIAGLRVVADF